MFFPEKCHWSGRQRNASLTTSVAGCGERCLLQAAVLAASISRFVGDHSDEIGESDRAVIEGGGPSCDDFNVANTGQKTHKCDMCDKRFKQVKYRNKHFNEVHLRTKSFECEVCHKRFSRGYNLQTHMRIHTGERPFKCDLCEMAFVTNEALGQHNRTHTGEKPHECPTCHQAFAQHSNLTVHMRVHTGEKPFKCQSCTKAFAQSSNLTAHMRVHTKEITCERGNATVDGQGHLAVRGSATCDGALLRSAPLAFRRLGFEGHAFDDGLGCSPERERPNTTFDSEGELPLQLHQIPEDTGESFTCERCNTTFDDQGELEFHQTLEDT
eukprot:Polyplicarium_translucidae@DN3331_c2_g1_i12.p1